MADDPNGGIKQYIRLVIDKSGLGQLTADAREMGQKAAAEVAAALNGSTVINAVRNLGSTLTDSVRTSTVHAAQSMVSGFTDATHKVTTSMASMGQKIRSSWQRDIESMRKDLSLLVIPDQQPLSLSVMRKLGKQYGKGTDEFTAQVQRLQVQTQIASTKLAPFGKLLQAVGVNAYASSPKLQGMLEQVKASGNAAKGADGFFGGLKSTLGTLGNGLAGLIRQFGLFATVYKTISFLKESAVAAGQNQAEWARLSSTLADYGIKLSAVQPQLVTLTEDMTKLGMKQGDTVSVMASLLQITGDYSKSLRGVSIVVDLMTSRHMGLEQASKAVGRAIEGDYMALSRMGIYLDENRDALDQLSERMGGEAQAKMQTFAGQTQIAAAKLDLLHVAIGNALLNSSTGGGSGSFMTVWIKFLTDMAALVKENQEIFQALGVAISVLLQVILPLIKGTFVGFSGAIKLAESLFGIFYVGFKNLPDQASSSFNHVISAAAGMADKVIGLWDRITGVQHKSFEALKRDADAAAKAADARIEAHRQQLIRGFMSLWGPDAEGGPKAGDQPLGSAGKVAGKQDRVVSDQIRLLRSALLSNNPQFSADAQTKLNDLLGKQQERLDGLKDTDNNRKKNAGEILVIEKTITDIKAAQATYDKQQADIAGQRRRDSERTAEIERLGKVNRQGTTTGDQQHAAEQLNKLESQITRERAKQVQYGERYWILTSQIDLIETQKKNKLTDQDRLYTKQVKDLADRVKFHVDEIGAMTELQALGAQIFEQQQAANKIKDQALRLETLRTLALRQQLVDEAMRTQLSERELRAQVDMSRLADPEKRKAAEKDLLVIRRQLLDMEYARKQIGLDTVAIQALILQITQQIALYQDLDTRALERKVKLAEHEGKNPKYRADALRNLVDMKAQVDKELERTDITAGRRNELTVLADQINDAIKKIRVPINALYSDIVETFKDNLPMIIEEGAKKATNAWVSGIQLIIANSRHAKAGLKDMFGGLAKAYATEISDLAKIKVKEHIAASIGQLAEAAGNVAAGRYTAAAKNVESAGLHLLSAAKWGLLAGAAANAAGGSPAGSGGGTGQNTNTTAGKITQGGPTLYIRVDGIDPRNPVHQELAGQTIQQYYQRTGGQLFTSAG